jgi:cell wall-associated NlpC family hydrolase
MPPQPRPLRSAPTAPITRRAAVLVTVVVFALAAAAGPAQADQIGQKRAEITAAQQQLMAYDAKLESAVEAYNGAKSQLDEVRAQIEANTKALNVARKNLAAAKKNLAEFLVSSYKGQNADVAFYVLGSGSFSDLVDRVDYVQRMSQTEGDLLAQVISAEKEIAKRQAQLKKDRARAKQLVAQTLEHKKSVEAAMAEQQNYVAGLRGDLRQLIQEKQAREDAAAKARAEALAQQQAAQSSAGSSGDSSGGSSGGSGGGGGGGGGYVPPPNGTLGQQAVAIAQRYLGVPYVWGGASPSGFDCSGLTMYVYGQLGISLPHYTGAQWNAGPHVSMSQLAPGDLVFFYSGLSHVGLYMGGGLFIHAPHTGDVVKISSLSGYYAANFAGGVRVTG